jgi:DNA-binding NtrC family response regulator
MAGMALANTMGKNMDYGCQPVRPQPLAKLIGVAPDFLKTIDLIPAVAASGAAVLISGETGTGKELVAHAIHYLSAQAEYPFVAVNCGALADTLLEDELFGHERGAFTSADLRREGLVAQAEKGTLFLDEVDTLAPKAQVDLLRVLQDQKYRMIGSNRERDANARIVAATNVPLDQLLHSGKFRTDLFYRLCVFTLTLAPLRCRKQDIPALAGHFLIKHSPKWKSGLGFSSAALEALLAWDWPGNVRELENAVVRSIHLSHGDQIEVGDLGLSVRGAEPSPFSSPAQLTSFRAMKQASIAAFEKNYLIRLMFEHGGNVSQAAVAARKERRDLGKLLKKYKLDPKSFRSHLQLWEA